MEEKKEEKWHFQKNLGLYPGPAIYHARTSRLLCLSDPQLPHWRNEDGDANNTNTVANYGSCFLRFLNR